MVDRTRDFLRLTNETAAALAKPLATPPALLARPRPTTKALHFTQKATQISKGIQTCALLLARLTSVARSQNLFSDDADELGRLSVTVKNEMSDVKRQLAELQVWLSANDLGQGKDSKMHSEAVVKTMEHKLHDSGKTFVRLLETRKTILVEQSQRKRIFGGDDVDLGLPMSFATSSGGDLEAQQQALVIPDTQYMRSRVDAINSVEKYITDLGQVMGTLATLISQQDHQVNDLANNVDGANLDLRAGFAQIERYYNSIRGNQRLVMRLFLVVVSFLLFFLLFLA
jgi:syntaxin 5